MQRRKKDKRMGAVEWLERRFDITPDVFQGVRIEICGQHRLLVQGCTKILKYSEQEMLLDLGKLRLRVCGERLWCTSFISGALGVGGCIDSVSFIEGEHT
ncbi:MAG: YabP/YqfC family sporulation protein [Clostridia bacterium]|jgi:hypothetical protein|nr:YabP/YqfC family sporulation protein [Clostridia bacterium]MBQ5793167.1 YabP/YqfC family sporulation protein [Clostridia bacterium]